MKGLTCLAPDATDEWSHALSGLEDHPMRSIIPILFMSGASFGPSPKIEPAPRTKVTNEVAD